MPIKCLNPIQFKNKYTGQQVVRPCGYCELCQKGKQSVYIERLKDEAKYYKYGDMITLTYNNLHIPLTQISFSNITIDKKGKIENIKNDLENPYISDIINFIRNWEYIKNDKDILLQYLDKVRELDLSKELEKIKRSLLTEKHFMDEAKELYIALINKYTTLRYKDLKRYIVDNTTPNRYRDLDFKLFFAGEYPNIELGRARPHYHGIILYNDIYDILHFLQSWYWGNISFGKGDNYIDRKPENNKYPVRRTKIKNGIHSVYPSVNTEIRPCKINENGDFDYSENKEDIERLLYYIENENIKLGNNQNNGKIAGYILSYTFKKERAKLANSKEIQKLKNIDFKDINKNNIRDLRKAYSFIKKWEGKYINNTSFDSRNNLPYKEDAKIYKSKELGYRWVKDNIQELLRNNFKRGYYDKNNNFKYRLVNNSYIKYAQKITNKELVNISVNKFKYTEKEKDIINFCNKNDYKIEYLDERIIIDEKEKINIKKQNNFWELIYQKALLCLNKKQPKRALIEIPEIWELYKAGLKNKNVDYISITLILGLIRKNIKELTKMLTIQSFIESKIYSKYYNIKSKIDAYVNKNYSRINWHKESKRLFNRVKDDFKINIDLMLDKTIYAIKRYNNQIDFVYLGKSEQDYNELKKRYIIFNYEIQKVKEKLFKGIEERDIIYGSGQDRITPAEIHLTIKERENSLKTPPERNEGQPKGNDNETVLKIGDKEYKYLDSKINKNMPILQAGVSLDEVDNIVERLKKKMPNRDYKFKDMRTVEKIEETLKNIEYKGKLDEKTDEEKVKDWEEYENWKKELEKKQITMTSKELEDWLKYGY